MSLKIRLWGNRNEVEELVEILEEHLNKYGYKLTDASRLYPCRPPKQNETRKYLTFDWDFSDDSPTPGRLLESDFVDPDIQIIKEFINDDN